MEMELFNELLSIWHAHRFELLLLFGAVLVVYRLVPSRQSPMEDRPYDREILSESSLFIRQGSKDTIIPLSASKSAPAQRPRPPQQKADGPKRIKGARRSSPQAVDVRGSTESILVQPVIFYYSLGGSTARLAKDLQTEMSATLSEEPGSAPIEIHDLAELDFDAYFVSPKSSEPRTQRLYLLLLPTYNIDTELDTFIECLRETHNDFRIDTAPLRNLAGYSVFGFGDREHWPTEDTGYCSQATEVDKWMARLTGGKRAFPLGMGDTKTNARQNMGEWWAGVNEVASSIASGQGLGEGVPGSGDAAESDEEDVESDDSESTPAPLRSSNKRKRPSPGTTDLEDIRAPITSAPLETDFTTDPTPQPKPMVAPTSTTYSSLTKQGYTIVGTHSGVKICRWTKSALRGRGSCYKYSFYGIASHRCMEATPSLSCSNKCVFCWRHGTNPVSTTWRWTVDPPDLVFAGIKAGHYAKIKSLRGVPGVRAERFAEAMRIRHCALSLVGEPIFYPHINALLRMLHAERISTFLVCNAQHPAQLRALDKVTQLYVSIDASTKEGLKRIDRPLHRDYWERFLECMDILRERRDEQRTVFRLTLVKGFNIEEEAEGYAALVERARPGFVEVKGVTYCGTSTSVAAGLTMRNVPFYEEVCSFVEALAAALERRGLGYGVAAEHAHSCCILLAEKRRFHKEDGWHTLIDYERFFENLESGRSFGPEDYVGKKTPEWALYGNGGFDPRDQRVDRKGRVKEDQGVSSGQQRTVVDI